MKRILLITLLAQILSPSILRSTTYYVAGNGNDSNNGTTLSTPFKTLAKAVGLSSLAAGDLIYVRGGTYAVTSAITLSKSGTAASPIRLEAYPGERALFNFTGIASGKRGFTLSGSYWYLKGLDLCKATDNGIIITGACNTVEFCSFFDNGDSGMQLSGGAHDNRIVNCDSYWNADPTDYGDADGFACKMDVGSNNSFYGCRSWLNVDDGWDGYLRGANDVTTLVENCWTWRNGYFKDGTDAGSNANGNGFKMGGSDDKTLMHNFTLKNCIAFYNKAKGFDQNNNKGNMTLYNCTGCGNIGNDFSISSTLNTGKTCTVVNCVDVVKTKVSLGSFVTQLTNSWLTPFTVANDDFLSLDSLGVTGPRQADGSLPKLNFLRLKAGSDLIDAGTNVGLPYSGKAPDLGAYETESIVALKGNLQRPVASYFRGNELYVNTLPAEGATGYRLLDFSGRLLQHGVLNGQPICCEGLPQGLYLLELSGASRNRTVKLFR